MSLSFGLFKALVLLVSISVNVTGEKPNVQTLFDTSSSSGGCSSQVPLLNTYLNEARALMDAATTGYMNWQKDPNYQLMLISWLGINFIGGPQAVGPKAVMDDDSEDLFEDEIKKRFSGVQSFLDGVSLTMQDGGSYHPRLFCSPKFTQPFDWSSAVFDNLGEPIPKDTTDAAGQPEYWTIQDAYPGLYQGSQGIQRPLWVTNLDGYLFFNGPESERVDPNGQPWTSICAPPSVLAFTTGGSKKTSNALLADVATSRAFGRNVVLCPKSFNPSQYGSKLHTLAKLTNSPYPPHASSGGLDKWIPRSGTLFHELFHLTDSEGATPDFAMNIRDGIRYSVSGDDNQKLSIVKNPESYLWFAVACWYYQNPPSGTVPVAFRAPDGQAWDQIVVH